MFRIIGRKNTTDFVSSLVKENHDYFIVLRESAKGKEWVNIDPVVTDHFVYAPKGEIAVFTSVGLHENSHIGEPLELLCLACFYHIVRRSNRFRHSIIDGKYRVRIKPWRAPCETTAVYEEGKYAYYLEGCRHSGVYWRAIKDCPKTEPPFISCGAFDTNAGCWQEDCPHGVYFEDDEAPFLASGY